MERSTSNKRVCIAWIGLSFCSCTPLHDLDKAAGDPGGAGGSTTRWDGNSPGFGGSAGTSDSSVDSWPACGTGGGTGGGSVDAPEAVGGAQGTGGAGGAVVGRDARDALSSRDAEAGSDAAGTPGSGGVVRSGGQTSAGGKSGSGGVASSGGAAGSGGVTSNGGAAGLPDIPDSPVDGKITYSSGASWDIDGDQWPAFEIHTPTASYWLVKSAANIVSITDTSQTQWINFSSGYRSNCGVPNLGGCCAPGNPAKLGLPTMSTDLDPAFTPSPTHLRLISTSSDGDYWLVWDFFLTHFTLTINHVGKAFGFTYRGVPGRFDADDQLVLSSGVSRSATSPYSGDLPGPDEWAYLTHLAAKQSLFLIHHGDDSLEDTYRPADNDTGMFVFGNGQMTETPVRFSLGLIDSCDGQKVRDRIDFVRNAIH